MPTSCSLRRLGVVVAVFLLIASNGFPQTVPNPNREVHPSIADIVPGVTHLHGTAPMFQYPDGVWNHGEGFAPVGIADADYGGWHRPPPSMGPEDGTNVTSADVHTTHNWTTWTWESDVHPAAPHQMLRFVGHLRPAGLTRKNTHPLYGDLTQATLSGPFGDRTYVDQAAFEMFRPLVGPSANKKIVIVVQCLQTVPMPKDMSDVSHGWLQVYQGFFSPDGLVRRERGGFPRVPDTLFGNNADADVVRPDQHLIATWNEAKDYWPITVYPALSTAGRPATLCEQRYLQLVQAIKCILQENTSRNPLQNDPLTLQEIDDRVVVVCTGGSNGGLGGQWLTLRYPNLVHGFYAEVIPPAYQRLYGEQDLGFAINHLSGSQEPLGINEGDFLNWNQYAWSTGHEVYDLSYLRQFLAGNTYRPGCFFVGDEDHTSNGADWIRVLSGTNWTPAGELQSPSAFGSPVHHTLAWAAAERRGHTQLLAPIVNPYGPGTTMHGRDLAHVTIERAIGQKAAQPFVPPANPVVHEPHKGDHNLRGLDDVHEWALGRLGEPPPVQQPSDPLVLDTAFFASSQPGAAGTRLGFRESMKIHGETVYVGSAEGIVSAFEVDQTHPKRPLKKIAQSPPLGHGAYAMAIVGSGAQASLVVGTRRHLHRLGLATSGSDQLPVLQPAVRLWWEVAQPHSLQVPDVLSSNPGDELIFASKHGGLVFYSTSLAPVYEWPEPGIVDFVVQGSAVTILSHRGMLATVTFDSSNHATLHAASVPLQRNLTQFVSPSVDALDSPTQGGPHDLELMLVNLGPYGVLPGFVSAWTSDTDSVSGLALRLFNPVNLDRVPLLIGSIQNLTFTGGRGGIDLATCRESGSNPIGDHLLVLSNDHLALFDQMGVEVGKKALRIHGPPFVPGTPIRPPYHYPFGEQAHSLVVGELGVQSGGTYSEEVVIATQSGSLTWMHIDEIATPDLELPAAENANGTWQSGFWVEGRRSLQNVAGADPETQPRTNQSLSATWGITTKPGDPNHLHVLDQRGGYWIVDAAGNIELWERALMGGSKGWNYLGPVSAPPLGGLVDDFLTVAPFVAQNYLFEVATRPWRPIDVNSVIFETEPKYKHDNWSREGWLTQRVFEGFHVHAAGGSVIPGTVAAAAEAWSWSLGNLVEGVRVQPSSVVDGLWASTAWPLTLDPSTGHGDLVKYEDLRHPASTHAAEQQALVAVKLQSGQTVLVLGCPGGRVRVLHPGVWREDSHEEDHHELGLSLQSGAVDHGFGGCALAVRHETTGSGERLRIFFGTLYEPVKRPSLYGSAASHVQLMEDELAYGGIHEYTWAPGQGLTGPLQSVQLQPTSAWPRGGYGVVGLKLGDLLDAPGEELIACTLAGDIFVFPVDQASGALGQPWRTHVPGAVGFYNAIVVANLDGDPFNELYVAGSYGLWRFHRDV